MLISGFIHLHDYTNAFSIFEEMIKSGLQPDRAIYNLLIEAFCKMGNMDRAIRILEKMQKERMQPSNRAFRPIIEGYAVAGDMKKALDILDLMRRSGCAPTVMTYNALIHGLIKKNQVFFFSRTGQLFKLKPCPDVISYLCLFRLKGLFLFLTRCPLLALHRTNIHTQSS
jgi:pentatricopeptide repeat protein